LLSIGEQLTYLFGRPAELPTRALAMDQLQEAGLLGEVAAQVAKKKK
jgi:hypothetical protein